METAETALRVTSERRPARLAEPVVATLVDEIVSGAAADGTALAREDDLAARFGVSRTVIREAIKTLESKGLVRSKQGRGTLVQSAEAWNLLDAQVLAVTIAHDHDFALQDQLAALRITLEGEMAAQAARQLTQSRRAALNERFTALVANQDQPARYLDLDFEFHREIARQSGNRLAFHVLDTAHSQIRQRLQWHSVPAREFRKTHMEHSQIYQALLTGDPEQARRAVTDHIAAAWRRRRRLLSATR